MLELHKTIRWSHAAACPIVAILFYRRSWQGGVLKVLNNDFLVFLFVWHFFKRFWVG